MDHGEMNTKETTILKRIPGYDVVMELEHRKEELKGVENRMKKFIGEKKIDDLNLRELIEFEKKLETLQPKKTVENIRVKDMTEETRDVMILKEFVKYKIGEMETKIFKPQDEFDIIMEAIETKEGRVKGLKMRMKVFIDEKECEDIHLEELIEFNKKLETLHPKSVEDMHLEDMREEIKDIIIMKEIVKKMIAKRDPSSSRTMIIPNYFN